jgi:hypothetical protein
MEVNRRRMEERAGLGTEGDVQGKESSQCISTCFGDG